MTDDLIAEAKGQILGRLLQELIDDEDLRQQAVRALIEPRVPMSPGSPYQYNQHDFLTGRHKMDAYIYQTVARLGGGYILPHDNAIAFAAHMAAILRHVKS